MKKLKLTVNELFMIMSLMDKPGGTMDAWSMGQKINDKVRLNEEETKEVGFKTILNKDGTAKGSTWKKNNWEKEVEFNEEQFKFTEALMKKRDEADEWDINNGGPFAPDVREKMDVLNNKEKDAE